MPLSTTDGPGGLEVLWTWDSPLGSININHRDRSVLPRVELRSPIEGWGSLPEFDAPSDPSTSLIGEVPYPGLPKGKTIVCKCRLIGGGQDSSALRGLATQMRNIFGSSMNGFGRMHLTPHASYGGTGWYFDARVLSYEGPDATDVAENGKRNSNGEYQLEGTLSLRIHDPRFYLDASADMSETHAGGTFNVNSESLYYTDPTFDITVPAALDPVFVENLSLLHPITNTHGILRFNGMPSGALHIDFRRPRRMTIDPGTGAVDAAAYLDRFASNWMDGDDLIPGLIPGINQIRINGVTTWTMSWRIASL